MRCGWPTGKHAKLRPVAEAVALGTILMQLRSAPLTSDDAASILAVLKERELIEGGAVKAGPGSESFAAFLERFWTYDTSPYVREKLAHGQRIGRRRCYDATIEIKAHCDPHFAGKRLADVSRPDVRDFGLVLADAGLAPKTTNNVLEYGTVALRWAYRTECSGPTPPWGFAVSPAKRRPVACQPPRKPPPSSGSSGPPTVPAWEVCWAPRPGSQQAKLWG